MLGYLWRNRQTYGALSCQMTEFLHLMWLRLRYFSLKVKADIALHGNPISELYGRHLPYGITQCHLPPDTSEHVPPISSHAGWYSIYLPRRDVRLSWPSWLDSAPARSRTSDLSITSLTPKRCTTKATVWATCKVCKVSNHRIEITDLHDGQ